MFYFTEEEPVLNKEIKVKPVKIGVNQENKEIMKHMTTLQNTANNFLKNLSAC